MVSSEGDHDPSFSLAKCRAVYLKKMLPAIKRHARSAFRYLKPEAKQEAVQNVLANTWAALVGLARRGKLEKAFPSVLATFAEKQTRDHRIVGGHLDVNDVLSPYCIAKKNVKVDRLDRRDKDDDRQWCEVLVEDKHAGPADIARVRIDFNGWLASLKRRDRRVAEFLAQGESTRAAARQFKVSDGRISQLRKELAENWRRFVGDDEPGAAVAA